MVFRATEGRRPAIEHMGERWTARDESKSDAYLCAKYVSSKYTLEGPQEDFRERERFDNPKVRMDVTFIPPQGDDGWTVKFDVEVTRRDKHRTVDATNSRSFLIVDATPVGKLMEAYNEMGTDGFFDAASDFLSKKIVVMRKELRLNGGESEALGEMADWITYMRAQVEEKIFDNKEVLRKE